MDTCREILMASLEDAEAVVGDHYGPEAIADRLLVAQVAAVAADIRLRIGEGRLVQAIRGGLAT